MRRPGIWKRLWKGVIDSFVEGMLATNPVAYCDFRRCKADVGEQISMASQEQVVSVSKSAAQAAVLRGSVIHGQASKELAAL